MCIKVYIVIGALAAVNSVWGRHISEDTILQSAETFSCEEPQPRAYTVQELTKEEHIYYPHYVVLHRCGRAGCCQDQNESCQPDNIETVSLTVKYLNNDYLENVVVKTSNHTNCACLQNNTPIK